MGKAAKGILQIWEKNTFESENIRGHIRFNFKEIFFPFKKPISLSKYNHSEEIQINHVQIQNY
jgi:hypothetical protein